MAFYKYKGKRIRASDKSLVYRFCGGSLLLLFVAVILLLNMGQLMRTDWDKFSLISNDGLVLSLSPYHFITIIIATGSCLLVAFLYYRFCHDMLKRRCDEVKDFYDDLNVKLVRPKEYMMHGLVKSYQVLLKFLGWQDIGYLLAGGCYYLEDILKTDYPQQSYLLGKNIK